MTDRGSARKRRGSGTQRARDRSRPQRRRSLLIAMSVSVVALIVLGGLFVRQRLREPTPPEHLSALGEPTRSASPEPYPADPEAEARAVCQARLAQYQGDSDPLQTTLLASYPSRQGDVAAAEEGRSRPYDADHAERPSEEFVATCFFEADYFERPPRPDEPPSRERRQEVIRRDGTASMHTSGNARDVEPSPIPTRSPR